MSPLVPEPAPKVECAQPLISSEFLTSMLMGVEITDPVMITLDPDTGKGYVAYRLAERLSTMLWPRILATVEWRGGSISDPAPVITEVATRHQVRAEDRDPSRHGLGQAELEPAQVRLLDSAIAQREWTEHADRRREALALVVKSFSYQAPKDDQPGRYEWLRREAKDVALLIMDFCPESRERSLAITKLEEAVMWANKAIAVNE